MNKKIYWIIGVSLTIILVGSITLIIILKNLNKHITCKHKMDNDLFIEEIYYKKNEITKIKKISVGEYTMSEALEQEKRYKNCKILLKSSNVLKCSAKREGKTVKTIMEMKYTESVNKHIKDLENRGYTCDE
ncbi:MAG: hypothetical protein HFH45_01410 [Bacilli bacterium]|nr:hypothetical protein [Bacilli bacterium]